MPYATAARNSTVQTSVTIIPTGNTPNDTPGISTLTSAVTDATISDAEARTASSDSDGDGDSSPEDAMEKTPLRKEESDEERLVLTSTLSGLRAESTTLGRRIVCSSALHQISC